MHIIIGGQPAEVVGFSDDGIAYGVYEQVDDHNRSPLPSGQLYIFLVERLCNFIQYALLANVNIEFNVNAYCSMFPTKP